MSVFRTVPPRVFPFLQVLKRQKINDSKYSLDDLPEHDLGLVVNLLNPKPSPTTQPFQSNEQQFTIDPSDHEKELFPWLFDSKTEFQPVAANFQVEKAEENPKRKRKNKNESFKKVGSEK